jgi:hypothetical protein
MIGQHPKSGFGELLGEDEGGQHKALRFSRLSRSWEIWQAADRG